MRRFVRNLLVASLALGTALPVLASAAAVKHVVVKHVVVKRRVVRQTSGDGISIPMDEARVIAFGRPVKTVFVGNPTVADVNMIDPRHAFILGKAFGITNLIALDDNGNPVASRHVTVLGSQRLVTLNRGPDQFTYACATVRCEHARAPGDPRVPYDDNLNEITSREELAQKQAVASVGGKQ